MRFMDTKWNRMKQPPVFLTYDELQTVMNKEFTIPRLALVRDIFIFACFTGLAFVDVSTLKKKIWCKIIMETGGSEKEESN